MKKLKINLFAVVAFAIAAVTMSFTLVQNATLQAERWFEYTDETGDGNENNPANYVLTPSGGANPPVCPDGFTERCAVHAQPQSGTPSQPDLNTIIETRLREQQ